MKTTSAQITVPASVFLGLLNGVEGMQISVMPPDVAPADLMEMIEAARAHVQSLIDKDAEPAPAPTDAMAPATDETAVTLAPGETQTVTMSGGGTLTVSYPQAATPEEDESLPENEGE